MLKFCFTRFVMFFSLFDDSSLHVFVSLLCRQPTVALLNQYFVKVQTPLRTVQNFVYFIVWGVHGVGCFDHKGIKRERDCQYLKLGMQS